MRIAEFFIYRQDPRNFNEVEIDLSLLVHLDTLNLWVIWFYFHPSISIGDGPIMLMLERYYFFSRQVNFIYNWAVRP